MNRSAPLTRWPVALALALAFALAPGRADAGFVARISPGAAALAPGESQQFTVTLESEAGTPDAEVTGFTARLELTGAVAGVQFSGGEMPATGYIFQGNSGWFDAIPGPQNPGDPFPPGSPVQSITLTDFPNDPPYSVTLAGGGSWVLGVVTVTADPNPAGGPLEVKFSRDYSGLDSADGASLGLAFQDGAVLVEGSGEVSTVPAPGGLVLAAAGVPMLAVWLRRRAARS
jgi:hypothetical protein